MAKINFNKIILVSITGRREKNWQTKLKEINDLKITEIGLFLEIFTRPQREKIYKALLKSCVKSIPLVHIRDDMDKNELKFLKDNFKTKYFTIHERNFTEKDILKWKGFYKQLSLEMDFDNFVSKKVDVKKIGGFCVDLAHFKAGMEKLSKDFEYVFGRKAIKEYFDCNHINGYNPQTNCDMHTVRNLESFDYLKTLPKFVFGKAIAIETFNSIKEQLGFKKHLIKLLTEKFK
jgi:hypothetical protein